MARIFEAYIFGWVSVRAVTLLMQVLYLMKFLQKKSWCSCLHVRSAIDQLSESLIYWLVDLMGQSMIYTQTFQKVLLNSDLSFVCKVVSYVALDMLTN